MHLYLVNVDSLHWCLHSHVKVQCLGSTSCTHVNSDAKKHCCLSEYKCVKPSLLWPAVHATCGFPCMENLFLLSMSQLVRFFLVFFPQYMTGNEKNAPQMNRIPTFAVWKISACLLFWRQLVMFRFTLTFFAGHKKH